MIKCQHGAGLLLLMVMGVVGCSNVRSVHPLGSALPAEKLKELEQVGLLEGVFSVTVGEDNRIMHVKHLGEGRLSIAEVKWEENHFKLSEAEGLVTGIGEDHLVLNVRDKPTEADAQSMWQFMLLAPVTKQEMVLLPP